MKTGKTNIEHLVNGRKAAFAAGAYAPDGMCWTDGLSKKEYISTHILAGLCSREINIHNARIIKKTITLTNELLKQLENE